VTIKTAAKKMVHILEEYRNDPVLMEVAIVELQRELLEVEPEEMYWDK